MSKKLPPEVRLAIKETVFHKADEFDYCHKSRIESGIFMEQLVKDKEVGKILAEFMPKADIKTYIKDALLNRYAKDMKQSLLPSDTDELRKVIRKVTGEDSVFVDRAGSVYLFRLGGKNLVVVSQGTLIKWETALRKALEFIAKAPGLPPEEGDLRILLNIAVMGKPLTKGDREHIAAALKFVGVKVHFSEA